VELALGLLACALGGYIIARRGLNPITRMAETVRQIGSTTLNERIEPGGFPTELSTLALAFNTTLQRLEDAFTRLSRFSADIAHELRTPINNVRGLVEVSLSTTRPSEERDRLLAASLDECQRLSRLIDSLLFLARAENPQTQINRQTIDVAQELAKMQEFYEAACGEAGIGIELSAMPMIHAHLDRLLIQRALGNLIENALAHSPAGGSIRLAAERQEGQVRISVSDTGHGIPAEHLPYIFERFHRVDPSRSKNTGGLGLGLAMVKSIAALHGGTVEVSSQLASGSCFTLILPDRAA
jgi:two-component system heavy metal sensor histidine kinase CusS